MVTIYTINIINNEICVNSRGNTAVIPLKYIILI